MEIRLAALDDCQEILNIYAYYTTHTAISFEYDPPTPEEFRGRMERILKKYPYFVAVEDDAIVGYTYAGPFVGRAAYNWSAESTIYLAPNVKKCGIGKALYLALEEALKKMGVLNLYACIGDPDTEDEYLTKNSVDFHTHMGYRLVGTFQNCGYKFGRWYNMVWMEKILGDYQENQPPVRPYPEVANNK